MTEDKTGHDRFLQKRQTGRNATAIILLFVKLTA